MLELPKLSTDNVQLTALLETLMCNTYRPSNSEAYAEQRTLRIESILSFLVRARSQKQMTLVTAKMSLAELHAQISPAVWRMIN
eukprot:5104371-Pleurochrysis_carterae.AAC.1